MDLNKINIYKQSLTENKNLILTNYKILIALYEKYIEIYKKLLILDSNCTTLDTMNKLIITPPIPQIVKCSKIIIDNTSCTSTKYQLTQVNSSLPIYISEHFNHFETWSYNLTKSTMDIGTEFIIKTLVDNTIGTISQVLEYDPLSNTAVFLNLTTDNSNLLFKFMSVVNSPE